MIDDDDDDFQDHVISHHLHERESETEAGGAGHTRRLESHHHADWNVLLHWSLPGDVCLPQE